MEHRFLKWFPIILKPFQEKNSEHLTQKLPLKTASLSGILKKKLDEDDYKRHLEDKYSL